VAAATRTQQVVVPVGVAPSSDARALDGSDVRAARTEGSRHALLLFNGKARGDTVLGALGAALSARGWTTAWVDKQTASSPCPPHMLQAGLSRASRAITGLAD
jgi:hypothetical protein